MEFVKGGPQASRLLLELCCWPFCSCWLAVCAPRGCRASSGVLGRDRLFYCDEPNLIVREWNA